MRYIVLHFIRFSIEILMKSGGVGTETDVRISARIATEKTAYE